MSHVLVSDFFCYKSVLFRIILLNEITKIVTKPEGICWQNLMDDCLLYYFAYVAKKTAVMYEADGM